MTSDKPRYSRLSDILDLAIFMSSKIQGITINDIATRYSVSRRTAERMRDSLTCIFPSIDEIETADTQKHWGFTNYSIANLISFTAEEIGNIEQQQRRTTNKEAKIALAKAVEKMKALNTKSKINLENDVELFMETEGYAIRQMPQYKINLDVVEIFREALKASKMVKAIYHDKERLIEPLGLIYGEKIYLVARETAKGKDIYTYLLHKFENVSLTDQKFDKKDFNLKEYSELSFGIYHGEILDVELLFTPEAAEEARNYNFHPTQEIIENADGTLTVKFRASGDKAILWHIFKWGNGCKIIAPESLQEEYKAYLKEVLEQYQ